MTLASALDADQLAGAGTRPWFQSRSDLFAILGCVSAVNGFAGKIATTLGDHSLLTAILELGGVSAIVWFAIGCLFTISRDGSEVQESLPSDKAVAALILFLGFVPLNFAAAVGLLLCGIYLGATSRRDENVRRMAIVMIALTGPLIWGRFLLALFGPFILGLDARIAGALAGVPIQGNVVQFYGGGGTLYVALGCSSIHNMSLAVLLFVTLTQLFRMRYTRFLLLAGVASALAMAAFNMMRLATLARFPEYFALFHTGWGGTLFGAASFVVAGGIIAWGIHAELSR